MSTEARKPTDQEAPVNTIAMSDYRVIEIPGEGTHAFDRDSTTPICGRAFACLPYAIDWREEHASAELECWECESIAS